MGLLSINDINCIVAPLKFALEKRCPEVFFLIICHRHQIIVLTVKTVKLS